VWLGIFWKVCGVVVELFMWFNSES